VRDSKKLNPNQILSIIYGAKRVLSAEERNVICVRGASRVNNILEGILNITGDAFLINLSSVGLDDEICEVMVEVNEGGTAGITSLSLGKIPSCTIKGSGIEIPCFSKMLHFYRTFLSEVKKRNVENEDITKNLIIFLKHVLKAGIGVNDVDSIFELIDMIYCSINKTSFMRYSNFVGMANHPFLFEIRLALIRSISRFDIQSVANNEHLKGVVSLFEGSKKVNENIIKDFIQKRCICGFYSVRYEIDEFINQLRSFKDTEVDLSLIELTSNNFLVYSLSNPCECEEEDDKKRCVSHYSGETVAEFIGCLGRFLGGDTIRVILKSYSSLLKLAEIDKSLVSKMEILEKFPLKTILSLISTAGEDGLHLFELFRVVIEQFLESKDYIRRLINNELLANENGMDIETALDVWRSLIFRNAEMFVECIRSRREDVIILEDQSNNEVCRLIVRGIIKCINEGNGGRILSLQILTEIIFNHPSLSAFCEDEEFIENMLWGFVELDNEEELVLDRKSHINHWRLRFTSVVFTGTVCYRLKEMILGSVIQRIKRGRSSCLRNSFLLLFNLFNHKVRVKMGGFDDGLMHDCDSQNGVERIFRQNAAMFQNMQLLNAIFDKHEDFPHMRPSDMTEFACLLKRLLFLYLKSVMANLKKEDEAGMADDTAVQLYLDSLEEGVDLLLSGLFKPKSPKDHKRVEMASTNSSNNEEPEEIEKLEFLDDIDFRSPLSKWRILEKSVGESINLVCFFRNYLERYKLYTDDKAEGRKIIFF
jgi:hypothetical protein